MDLNKYEIIYTRNFLGDRLPLPLIILENIENGTKYIALIQAQSTFKSGTPPREIILRDLELYDEYLCLEAKKIKNIKDMQQLKQLELKLMNPENHSSHWIRICQKDMQQLKHGNAFTEAIFKNDDPNGALFLSEAAAIELIITSDSVPSTNKKAIIEHLIKGDTPFVTATDFRSIATIAHIDEELASFDKSLKMSGATETYGIKMALLKAGFDSKLYNEFSDLSNGLLDSFFEHMSQEHLEYSCSMIIAAGKSVVEQSTIGNQAAYQIAEKIGKDFLMNKFDSMTAGSLQSKRSMSDKKNDHNVILQILSDYRRQTIQR